MPRQGERWSPISVAVVWRLDEEFELGCGGMNSELCRFFDIDWYEVVVSMEIRCVATAAKLMPQFVRIVDEVAGAGSAEHGPAVAYAPVAVMVAEWLAAAQ